MPMGVEMGVSFSINPPPQGATVAFPFVKNFALSKQQRAKLDVSSANFFPPSFLEDLRDSDFFGVHMAIGIPENTVVLPSLILIFMRSPPSIVLPGPLFSSMSWRSMKGSARRVMRWLSSFLSL